jgi:hypothetical protein
MPHRGVTPLPVPSARTCAWGLTTMGEPDDYSNRKRSRLAPRLVPPRLVPPRSDRQHPLSVITPDAHEAAGDQESVVVTP